MSVAFYFDEHIKSAVTRALRAHGVDVITAQADGMTGSDDEVLLNRATELGRVIFTQDPDFLIEAAQRQRSGAIFTGVIFAEQRKISIRQCIEQLELIAVCSEPDEFYNIVYYLPM